MTTQHTPGPWTAEDVRTQGEHVYWRINSDGRALGFAGVYATKDDAEHEANARLIAAAPELADALRKAWRWLDAIDRSNLLSPGDFMDCAPNDFGRGVIADVLAKALGE